MKTLKPYAYQRRGIKRIHRFGGRALVADEMGLGKTCQALLYWDRYVRPTHPGPLVVVCPAYLKWNWEREVRTWLKLRAYVCEGERPPEFLPRAKVYVINYDILAPKKRKRRRGAARPRRSWVGVLRKLKPALVVPDEIQAIKERTSTRTRMVHKLQKGVPHFVALGGTAGVENCPFELFPVLNMIDPARWANAYPFAMRYCAPKMTPWGPVFKGATNLDELHRELKASCMIRRMKKDVLKDLPLRRSSIVPVDIDNRKEYVRAETDLVRWLMKFGKRKAKRAAAAEKLVKWAYLRRLAGQGKFKAIVEWVREFLKTGKKLLLFGIHTELLTWIYEAFRKEAGAVLVTGKVPAKNRTIMFDTFNADPRCRLMVGNIEAAGTGWSCRSCSTVAFVELAWNPSKHRQAGDRCHGIGRGVVGKRTTTVYLVAHGTVEETLVTMLQKKQKVQDELLDGKRRSGTDLDLRDKLESELLKRTYR